MQRDLHVAAVGVVGDPVVYKLSSDRRTTVSASAVVDTPEKLRCEATRERSLARWQVRP